MAYAAHCQQEAALDRWVFFSYFSLYGLFIYASSICFPEFHLSSLFLGLGIIFFLFHVFSYFVLRTVIVNS